MPYAAVIINRAIQAVNHTFTYKIPFMLQDKIIPGTVVQVPFGKEHLDGVVVELLTEPDWKGDDLKEIEGMIGEQPLFGQDLLSLSDYLANYYLSP